MLDPSQLRRALGQPVPSVITADVVAIVEDQRNRARAVVDRRTR